MQQDRLDTWMILGAVWTGPAAAALNASAALRGAQPLWYNTLASALLALFWVVWLVRYRTWRGRLLASFWLTAALLAVVLLAAIWQAATLPLMLEVTMYLGVALFLVPYFGLAEYLPAGAMYPLLLAVCMVWLGFHGYFLYRLKGKRGAQHEA